MICWNAVGGSLLLHLPAELGGTAAGSAGPRVLVECRGWAGHQRDAALRTVGNDVRQCPGSGQAVPPNKQT